MAKRPKARVAHVPEQSGPLFFPGRTRTERRRLAELETAGEIRPIGRRLYVRSRISNVEELVRRNWALIISTLFPRAQISHRTALEYHPSPEGDVFLTSTTNRLVEYPGLRVRFLRGPAPLEDDPMFMGMRASSLPRAFLENLSTSRGIAKTVSRADLEKRLDQALRDGGEKALNEYRDRAKKIAKKLGWTREGEQLEALIGALLGTRSTKGVSSPLGKARARGEPFDERCVERLQLLFAEIRGRALLDHADSFGFGDHFAHKAFFDAYFSNYIEGTTFELEEAERIVFEKRIPQRRPIDAQDITSTFALVSDPNEMRQTPSDYGELERLLLRRHQALMAPRPDALPGKFKEKSNRAGSTVFVHPDYVVGTLKRGMELLRDLPSGMPRAIFIMFLIADVHPFNDGNGRVARIMMNAELVANRSTTIIIPTAFRDEYIDTLRALTRRHRPTPVVDMLVKAQRFSRVDFSDYPVIVKHLMEHNWFEEPNSALKLVF